MHIFTRMSLKHLRLVWREREWERERWNSVMLKWERISTPAYIEKPKIGIFEEKSSEKFLNSIDMSYKNGGLQRKRKVCFSLLGKIRNRLDKKSYQYFGYPNLPFFPFLSVLLCMFFPALKTSSLGKNLILIHISF